MAILEPSPFGKLRGKLGNLIVYEVEGQTRVRARPVKVKDAKSPKQMAQRGRMRGIAGLFNQLDDPLYIFWDELTKGTTMNAYNLFMSRNIRNLDKEGRIVDLARLVVTQGDLPVPATAGAVPTEDGRLEITWDAKTGERGADGHLLQIAVYAPDGYKYMKIRIADETTVCRREGRYMWTLPEVEGPVHVYGFFRDKYRCEVSESFYLGTFGEEGKGDIC